VFATIFKSTSPPTPPPIAFVKSFGTFTTFFCVLHWEREREIKPKEEELLVVVVVTIGKVDDCPNGTARRSFGKKAKRGS
jgi:hypothetical protein